MQLRDLKAFNPDNGDIESLVEMLAYGNMILHQYRDLEDSAVEVPEWLQPKLNKIRREVIERQDDIIRKRITDAKLRIEQFKTPQEKKLELRAEIKRLEALVGKE